MVYAGPEHPHHCTESHARLIWRHNRWLIPTPKPFTTGTGRRKEAIARVRLVPGTGKVTVNGRDAAQYFGRQGSSLTTLLHRSV